MMRVLIIGGYGVFGHRLARLLADEAGLEIILAGRNLTKAEQACAIEGAARYKAMRLDRAQELAPQIETPPDIIVDASGPFQSYGENWDRVARYALSMGAHYLDLSDDAEFAKALLALDADAKAAGVILRPGLSTLPVISAAAVTEMAKDFPPIEAVTSGIAPSPKAVMGRGVIGAIATYAGKRAISVREAGAVTRDFGLTQTRRRTIAPPGALPLPSILFSSIDAPDAHALPKSIGSVRCFAGPRPGFLHRALIALAWGVRWRLLPGLGFLTPLFHKTQALVKIGEDRGGMFVEVSGQTRRRIWGLIAEGDDGPFIPSIPATILIRRLLHGAPPQPGARLSTDEISMDDLQVEFSKLRIVQGWREELTPAAPLFQHILGPAYDSLASPLQTLHDVRHDQAQHWSGKCEIARGANPLAHLIALIFRFPKSGSNIPLTVSIMRDGKREVWRRDFDGHIMQSSYALGRGYWAHLIGEAFGPFRIYMALERQAGETQARETQAGRLKFTPRGWSLFGIALPKFLCPRGEVFESIDDQGRANFHVDIRVPLIGRLVKYVGHLSPTK